MSDADMSLDLSSIHLVDTTTLRREFERIWGITRRNIEYLAAIWSELSTRDEPPPQLSAPWSHILPLVASGKLSSRAALAFGGSRRKAAIVATLPIDEQDKLAEEDAVTVVVPTNDPHRQKVTVKQVSVGGMTAKALERVIDSGRILSPLEQRNRGIVQDEAKRRITIEVSDSEFGRVRRAAIKAKKSIPEFCRALVLSGSKVAESTRGN